MSGQIRVLIVDDSALVRKVLKQGLSRASDIEVVGTAADPFEARDLLLKLKPDVMTLDIEMPRMNGIEFLRRLMPQFPMPTIVVSSLSTKGSAVAIEALSAGAVDVVGKPAHDVGYGLEEMMVDLQARVRVAAKVDRALLCSRLPIKTAKVQRVHFGASAKLVAIGASTGGPEALYHVLRAFPANIPAVLVAQHMPQGFAQGIAAALSRQVGIQVKEAKSGDRLLPGNAYLIPTGKRCKIRLSSASIALRLVTDERPGKHVDAIDTMMLSVAAQLREHAVGVILTGIGNDGARGLKAMRDAGAATIAQDHRSSLATAMPQAAVHAGAVQNQLKLAEIGPAIVDLLKENASAAIG